MLELVAAAAVCLSPCPQDPEPRRETLPDGSVVLVEGEFRDGLRHGIWQWSYVADDARVHGRTRVRGRYKDGQRIGKWFFYFKGKDDRAEGKFEDGLPVGKWEVWDRDGELDDSESGEYASELVRHADGTPARSTVFLNGCPSGRWRTWWPNGDPQLKAGFKTGKRVGKWQLVHANGASDPEMLSGDYDSFSLLAEVQDEIDLLEGLGGATVEAVEDSGASVDLPPEIELGGAGLRSRVGKRVKELIELDLSSADGRRRGMKLCTELRKACNGRSFGWESGGSSEDVEKKQLIAGRWHSLLWLTDDDFWAFDMSLPTYEKDDQILNPRLLRESCANRLRGPLLGARFDDSSRRKISADNRRVLEAALAWLAAHQEPDGRWSPSEFGERCPESSGRSCDGPGEEVQSVGVTGLALLALLGDGNIGRVGPYGDSVRRGLHWLLERQDQESGLISFSFLGTNQAGDRVRWVSYQQAFNHAIAAYVLAEAQLAAPSIPVERGLRKAVEYIQNARDRDGHGTWRYDVPSLGDSDTAFTGWMAIALKTAEHAGIEIEQEALTDSILWLEEVTDDVTGRVGYNDRGGRSARYEGPNAAYPVDQTEAMTAVGLHTRSLLGQSPSTSPIMLKSANLLLKALPEHKMTGNDLRVDWYYWYYGTHAMYQMGGKYWKLWRKALERAMLGSQRNDGHFKGSWDTDGPWAVIGGRVYTTAMAALSLEAEIRFPRFEER